MNRRTEQARLSFQPVYGDEGAFFRRFFDSPRRTGAVTPSGRHLAREMARAVDPRFVGQIVELGPGTGSVTQALIANGISPERLTLIEFDPLFCRILEKRYPSAQIIHGDAFNLRGSLAGGTSRSISAVVSGLPLLNERPFRRSRLLAEAFDLMGPDGVFVQFTYGFRSPIPRKTLLGRYVAKRGVPVLRNLPPASVWTYRRRAHSTLDPKDPSILEQAGRIAAQIAVKRTVAKSMVKRQSDRVRVIFSCEARAAIRRLRRTVTFDE